MSGRLRKIKLASLGSETQIIWSFFVGLRGGVEAVTETLKFSKTAGKPLSVTWLTTGITAFFQIQLLSVSAGSSVSATGVYGPPPASKLGVALFGILLVYPANK